MRNITLAVLVSLLVASCGRDTYVTQQIIDDDRLSKLELEIEQLRLGTIREIIDPCGDMPDKQDEILIISGNGNVFAYFEGSNSTRFLTILDEGQYVTSDLQACVFQINSNGSITYN